MIYLNTALIIISWCSIFNFISMICSDVTVSTTLCILIFIAMFIAQASIGLTANSSKYLNHTFTDENGNSQIISQEPNPNYPGDNNVKIAKTLYYFMPEGQAMEIGNNNFNDLYKMPIYSIIIIIMMNGIGIYIFSRKELR